MASFRGAPDDIAARASVIDQIQADVPMRKKPLMKPRNFLLLVGTFILALVVHLPIMDAFRMMEDPSFVFFLGRQLPMRIIWACLGSVLLYMFLLVFFFACAREEAKTDQSVFMIVSIVCTVLGLSLLMLSVPLKQQTMDVYDEIFNNCQFGPRTQRLYEYSTVLHGLRSTAKCSAMTSVTMCDGFQESMPYTGFLRQLEDEYQCAGFCYGNSTAKAAAAAVSAEPAAPATTTAAPATTNAHASLAVVKAPVQFVQKNDAFAIDATGAPAARSGLVQDARAAPGAPPAMLDQHAVADATPASAPLVSPLAIDLRSRRRFPPPADTAASGGPKKIRLAEALQQFVRERQLRETESVGAHQAPPASMLQVEANKSASFKADAEMPHSLQHQPQTVSFSALSADLPPAPGPWRKNTPGDAKLVDTNATQAQPGRKGTFPPTLFSRYNYQATCEGMIARDLKFQALGSAQFIYIEGVFLLLSVVFGGLLRICQLCVQLPKHNIANFP